MDGKKFREKENDFKNKNTRFGVFVLKPLINTFIHTHKYTRGIYAHK